MNDTYKGRELKDLNKEELIQVIYDLHKFIGDKEMELIEKRVDIERANSLAQRYKTRLEATQKGHLSLVTDAVLDKAILDKNMPKTAIMKWLQPAALINLDTDEAT